MGVEDDDGDLAVAEHTQLVGLGGGGVGGGAERGGAERGRVEPIEK